MWFTTGVQCHDAITFNNGFLNYYILDPSSKRKKKDILVQIECEVQNKDIEANEKDFSQ